MEEQKHSREFLGLLLLVFKSGKELPLLWNYARRLRRIAQNRNSEQKI
jgi:hypothetical protein